MKEQSFGPMPLAERNKRSLKPAEPGAPADGGGRLGCNRRVTWLSSLSLGR